MRNENKKIKRAKNSQKRVRALFNTGQRTHKNKKDYNRKKFKNFEKNY